MERVQVISDIIVSNKLVITPNKKDYFDDLFDFDGSVELVRIFYSKVWHRPYKYIKIGDITFAWMPSTAPPSCIEDLPINFEFKKGEKFVIADCCDVEKIELFFDNTKIKT